MRRKLEITTLAIIGVIASVMSFLYFYKLNNPSNIILYIILVVDLLLFFLSLYKLLMKPDNTKKWTALVSFLIIIGYLAFVQIAIYIYAIKNGSVYDFYAFFYFLSLSLFIAPSVIALLPLIWFLIKCLIENIFD